MSPSVDPWEMLADRECAQHGEINCPQCDRDWRDAAARDHETMVRTISHAIDELLDQADLADHLHNEHAGSLIRQLQGVWKAERNDQADHARTIRAAQK